jgi:hypothetical protein
MTNNYYIIIQNTNTGTVVEMDFNMESEGRYRLPHINWAGVATRVPYRVKLDCGSNIIVHRDEHFLIRDLALQAPGNAIVIITIYI